MYVVLPVDEETFNIDANSRAIAVPASFKKNGVGIQGDHTAEIVYFVIDRYFDNTDLAEQSMKIMIQYETAGGVKNSVPAFIRDVSSIQNKLIFGWILTEDITKVPGTVKFSVRFYKTVDDAEGNPKLIYSFSTLNSQITINRALDFDVASFDPDQNVSDLILNRLTNSKADGAVEAQLPIFIINLPESGKVDLKDADGIDDDSTSYTFAISASSPDAGFISYYWYRNDGNTVERIPEENTGFVYLETEDDIQHLNPLKIYYTVNSDGEYHRYIPSDTGYSELTLYERRAYCKVDKVGEYYAVVENKVGTSTKELISNKVEIPKPTMPNADTIIIANYDILTLYGWDEEVKYVRATKETDEEVETLNITAQPNEGDEISYQWYRVEGATEHLKELPDLENASYKLVKIEGATSANYDISETGWYTVDIIGNRNGAVVSFPSGKYYRLTSMPERPMFEEGGLIEEDVSLPAGDSVKVELQNLEYSDEINYKWYIDVDPVGDFENEDQDVEVPELEGKSVISNAELYAYSAKVLYCKAVNTYNKVKSVSVSSRRFFILDSIAR